MEAYVHDLADVQSGNIGAGTRICQYVVVLPGGHGGDEGCAAPRRGGGEPGSACAVFGGRR